MPLGQNERGYVKAKSEQKKPTIKEVQSDVDKISKMQIKLLLLVN